MYLSRVEIDTDNRQKIRSLSHLGAYHNWVEQSFPREISSKQRFRHLWRIDNLVGKSYLLILSQDKPSLDKLEKFGVPGTAQCKDYDSFLDRLRENQVLQFRLTANPTHKVTKPGEKQGRIFPHITVDQQLNWLVNRQERLGFKICKNKANEQLAFKIVGRSWQTLYHHHRRIKLCQVSYEGLLKVVNLESFKDALIRGIGREKAYGMGLLTVIPLKSNE